MIIKIFIFSLLIKSIAGNSPHYGDNQIVTLLNNHFNVTKGENKLLGHYFYKNKDKVIFQIEIETDKYNMNDDMFFSFDVISQLTNVSKRNFTHAIVIMHFNINALPIITKVELACSKKYFIDKKYSKYQWQKNCLFIQNN